MINKYPYTDFNEYNMDWIIKTVKDLTDQWAETHQEWVDTKAEWESYKEYIDNYFANLNLQEEVNNKINEMIAAGYFDTLFLTLFTTTITQKAGDVTADWIANNLMQETGYVIDSSLSVSNAAADAKVTGTKISEILHDIFMHNSGNILDYITKSDSVGGVSFTWADNYTCHVSGSYTSTSFVTIFSNNAAFPDGIEPGKTYIMDCGGTNVNLAVYAWVSGNLTQLAIERYQTTFTVPATATGILIRLLVWGNTTVNEDVTPVILTQYTNKMIESQVTDIYARALFNNKVVGSGVYSTCDDADTNTIIFVGSTGGVLDISDFPLGNPGWLQTIEANSNVKFQIAFPYFTNENLMYRTKQIGDGWTLWKTIGGGVTTIVREVSNDTYNNTYNITTSPTITTDDNGWLQAVDTNTASEVGKTDMTGAIMSMLTSTGYCHLSPGIFYVSGDIDMPAGSILEGCGKDTIIRLLSSVSSGYICRMKEYATIKDICFSGGYNQGDISNGNIGGRIGVNFIGNRDGLTPSITPATTKVSQISNCWFENLDSGIYGYNSGGGLNEGMIVSDCYFTRCKAGINLDYWCEYCKFSNCVMFECYYACINNGGNNVFTGCTFHGVEGFVIDNSGNDKPNNGHGSAIGCTFNHIDNINNPGILGCGIGIKILDIATGFVFSGCQLWYGTVHVENSNGIVLSNCEFGGLRADHPVIATIGTKPIFMNGCIFQATPTFNIATPYIANNCYDFAGNVIS